MPCTTRSEYSAALTLQSMARAASEPRKRPRLERPDPWGVLSAHGDRLSRTASALGELGVALSSHPDTWPLLSTLVDAVSHDALVLGDKSWRQGIKLGKAQREAEVKELVALVGVLSEGKLSDHTGD